MQSNRRKELQESQFLQKMDSNICLILSLFVAKTEEQALGAEVCVVNNCPSFPVCFTASKLHRARCSLQAFTCMKSSSGLMLTLLISEITTRCFVR